jgi:predicted GNAT family acetyltransferase
VETSADFVPLLKAAFPEMKEWKRVILEQRASPSLVAPIASLVRRLESSDAYHLWSLSPEIEWIGGTWGGMSGLAASGFAWGAFVEGQLASVACSFFVGETYEDIGIVTEPKFRGLGLSTACAGALCGDIQARRHRPCWSTSPDNTASLRVSEKLGFVVQRYDLLYAVGVGIPEPGS